MQDAHVVAVVQNPALAGGAEAARAEVERRTPAPAAQAVLAAGSAEDQRRLERSQTLWGHRGPHMG